jgi:hypothetical protein
MGVMAIDWIDDDTLSGAEKLARFAALHPEPTLSEPRTKRPQPGTIFIRGSASLVFERQRIVRSQWSTGVERTPV